MKAEFNGTYGSSKTPCTIFFYDGWYCVENSINVNRTNDDLFNGVDVESLSDYDCFTWSTPIESLEELINAVDE